MWANGHTCRRFISIFLKILFSYELKFRSILTRPHHSTEPPPLWARLGTQFLHSHLLSGRGILEWSELQNSYFQKQILIEYRYWPVEEYVSSHAFVISSLNFYRRIVVGGWCSAIFSSVLDTVGIFWNKYFDILIQAPPSCCGPTLLEWAQPKIVPLLTHYKMEPLYYPS